MGAWFRAARRRGRRGGREGSRGWARFSPAAARPTDALAGHGGNRGGMRPASVAARGAASPSSIGRCPDPCGAIAASRDLNRIEKGFLPVWRQVPQGTSGATIAPRRPGRRPWTARRARGVRPLSPASQGLLADRPPHTNDGRRSLCWARRVRVIPGFSASRAIASRFGGAANHRSDPPVQHGDRRLHARARQWVLTCGELGPGPSRRDLDRMEDDTSSNLAGAPERRRRAGDLAH